MADSILIRVGAKLIVIKCWFTAVCTLMNEIRLYDQVHRLLKAAQSYNSVARNFNKL